MFKSFKNQAKKYPIPTFFLLTFLLSWTLWLPVGLLAPKLFLLAVIPGMWAPTISAILLTGLGEGKAGIGVFLGRLLKWRVGFKWYLVVLFGTAVIAYAAVGINLFFGGDIPEISLPVGAPREAWLIVLPIVFFVNIFFGGPLAEDIGWRGYILSKLKERTNALNASLIIGIVWALWHVPFFIFPEGYAAVGSIPFVWFALMTIAWSVLFAWVYVNTESILMPVLFHASINTTLGSLGVLGQSSGDLLPVILNTIITWLAVTIVIIRLGKDLKRKT